MNIAETESRSSCGRVLIADDDAISRKILRSWLENWGYQVTVAENGAIAWNILQREHPPELLILDWVMPEIDGMELCRRIRDRQHSPLPIHPVGYGQRRKTGRGERVRRGGRRLPEKTAR